MPRRFISSGSSFEDKVGYARAVVDGEWVFVSGTTGFDYSRMTLAESNEEQTRQCLVNIDAALSQAGASARDIVRVTYIVPEPALFERCWPILRRYFAESKPAATMLSAGLIDPRLKIEIEVTARMSRP
jgi:enamine deaminase RidA (YjgF/YER057c/UK114 family)